MRPRGRRTVLRQYTSVAVNLIYCWWGAGLGVEYIMFGMCTSILERGLVARYPLQKLNLRARRQSRVAVVATAAAAAAAGFFMEPVACKHLIDLPDELLQQIMLATNVQAVVACAQACSMLASLVRSEELWEALCVASWPLVHRLPRPAYSSWRLCHRSRCSGTIPGTWRKLLPLYDESALLAIERPGGWIGRLGAVLLRIRSIRKLHGLNTWPRVGARGSRSGVSLALNDEEGLSWLHSVHNALSRAQAAEELLAFAGGAPPELPSDREETEEEDAMRMPHRARTPD